MASLFIVTILVFIFVYIPNSQKLGRLRKECNDLNKHIEAAQAKIKNMPDPEKDIIVMNEKLKEAQDKFVRADQLPRVIEQLFKKTTDLNIEVISMRPREFSPQGEGASLQANNKIYIEVKMRCNYVELGKYIESLGNLRSLFTVEDISIIKDPGNKTVEQLVVDLLLACYLYPQV